MSFDPYEPYGPVRETTLRVVTWNVWGRYGDWARRQDGIENALSTKSPDIVCLVESWSTPEVSQDRLVAERLGMDHSTFVGGWQQEGWTSGISIATRWPVARQEARPLPLDGGSPGTALFALVDGPRDPIQLFVVMLDYPLHASRVRQSQVRLLAAFIDEVADAQYPIIVCGDFNAGPDADEIRMLTGRTDTVIPGLVFYDAWEVAGDGSSGITWSNANPLAAAGMFPDRRFDYIFSAWPRLGAVGHPVHCELLGVLLEDEPQLSDHYGVLAELRY